MRKMLGITDSTNTKMKQTSAEIGDELKMLCYVITSDLVYG